MVNVSAAILTPASTRGTHPVASLQLTSCNHHHHADVMSCATFERASRMMAFRTAQPCARRKHCEVPSTHTQGFHLTHQAIVVGICAVPSTYETLYCVGRRASISYANPSLIATQCVASGTFLEPSICSNAFPIHSAERMKPYGPHMWSHNESSSANP